MHLVELALRHRPRRTLGFAALAQRLERRGRGVRGVQLVGVAELRVVGEDRQHAWPGHDPKTCAANEKATVIMRHFESSLFQDENEEFNTIFCLLVTFLHKASYS